MRRFLLATFAVLGLSAAASATGGLFRLSGWSEIPSTYRHPGPVSGQFTTGPVNGVTPPYDGQPIPGFSGMIPAGRAGRFIGLPDNGFGAQGNSADFIIGFYEVTPRFKRKGDGTTSRGAVQVHGFTPFSDPLGLLDSGDIANGPVFTRRTYYPTSTILVDPRITIGRLLTGADLDVESIARMEMARSG